MEGIDYTGILNDILYQLETVQESVYSVEVAQISTENALNFHLQVMVALFIIFVVVELFLEGR